MCPPPCAYTHHDSIKEQKGIWVHAIAWKHQIPFCSELAKKQNKTPLHTLIQRTAVQRHFGGTREGKAGNNSTTGLQWARMAGELPALWLVRMEVGLHDIKGKTRWLCLSCQKQEILESQLLVNKFTLPVIINYGTWLPVFSPLHKQLSVLYVYLSIDWVFIAVLRQKHSLWIWTVYSFNSRLKVALKSFDCTLNSQKQLYSKGYHGKLASLKFKHLYTLLLT